MATITHDGQSLLIDGRRIWIVSGMLDYFRIPRQHWADRIRDAVEGGLNTILVRCPWSVHEPRQGEAVFDGQADVGHFIGLIADHGLRCILRPGPYIGADLDLGGMPSWLLAEKNLILREGKAAFLEAVSRHFGRLLGQLSPLSGANDGPIVIVQCEHEWFCGNTEAAQAYLLEIARFIREHDFDLPLINTNGLWQHREETIDTWSGRDDMLVQLRQLRAIQPNRPLIVGDFWAGDVDTWDAPQSSPTPPPELMHSLAQILAAGAQFNISPFHGGTNLGFMAGRLAGACDRFATTSADCQAPLGEAGRRGDAYRLLRRLCTFASQFGRVFAALIPEKGPAVLAVSSDSPTRGDAGLSVVHLKGTQGSIVLVLGDPKKANQQASIVLSDGRVINLELGDQPVAWVLLDVHIAGRAKLDWTNLNAFAHNGSKTLVLYGAPGQAGRICVNNSLLEVEVPRGQVPTVETHEDLTLVICNGAMVDATYVRDGLVYVGIRGFDAASRPIPAAGWKSRRVIDDNGKTSRVSQTAPTRRRTPIKLEGWSAAGITEYLDGSAPRYATIDGPKTQEQCAAGSGYGFIRLTLKKGRGKKKSLLAPGAGDRLHFYVKGQLQTIVGQGPGATDGRFELTIPPGSQPMIVAMIDNLGRYAGGNDMGEGKGLLTDLYEVETIKLGKPTVEDRPLLRPFGIKHYVEGLLDGETTSGSDLVWKLDYRKKAGLILEIVGAQSPALVVLNNTPVAYYAGATGRPCLRLRLDPELVRRGNNELRLAPMEPATETDLAGALRLFATKSIVTEGANWSFAKWEQPKPLAFKQCVTKAQHKPMADRPVWYRCTFDCKPPVQPYWLEPAGLTKGQIYLNGHNVGRYFVATPDGKAVGPQKRYLLPTPWLNFHKPNELVIFEEHGRSHWRVRIVQDDSAF